MESLHRQRVRVVKEMDLKSIGLARAGSNPAVVDAVLLHVRKGWAPSHACARVQQYVRYPQHPTSKNFVSEFYLKFLNKNLGRNS